MSFRVVAASLALTIFAPCTSYSGEMILRPVTLAEAMKSTKSAEAARLTKEVRETSLDLNEQMDRDYAMGRDHDSIFLLFYNGAEAMGCNRDYVIQRVKVDKAIYDRHTDEYLVEVMKLNNEKKMKKPDQHLKRYNLGKTYRRDIVVSCEIGCGEIPNLVTGQPWPYDAGILYKKIHDYEESSLIYDQVRFDFSRSYETKISFSRAGETDVTLPDFIPN